MKIMESLPRYSDMKETEKKFEQITKDPWYVKPLAWILSKVLGSDDPRGRK